MKCEKIHRFHVREDNGRFQQMYQLHSRESFVSTCKVRYIVRGFTSLYPYKAKYLLCLRWKGISWNRKEYE